MDQDIKREFDRLNRKIEALKQEQAKATWVSASWVTDLTGWSPRRMQLARQQGIVEYKESRGGGYLYKLESIPDRFIKKQAS